MHHCECALVVDDDPIVRTLLQSFFISSGCAKVLEAENGEQALEFLGQNQDELDLIVCDLKMPKMDGLEFLQNLKMRQFSGELVIISGESVSVLNAAKELSMAYGLNLRSAIVKPLTKRKLDDVFSATVDTPGALGDPAAHGKLSQVIKENRIIGYYQPRIDVNSRNVVGVEARAFCLDDRKKVVDARLLQSTYGKHLISQDLAYALLEKTLYQIRTWKSRGLKLNSGIEFASSTIIASGFYDHLLAKVSEAGAEPSDLTIAVEETEVQRNFIDILSVAARLRLQGFNFAVKNYQACISSANLLSRLPINQIEVNACGSSGKPLSASVLKQAFSLAAEREITIVLSGVDESEHLAELPFGDIDYVQGNLIGQMMSGPELEQWYLKTGGKVATEGLLVGNQTDENDAASVLRAVS